MTTEELAKLLVRISVLDNRTVDKLTLEFWEPLIGDIDYDRALEAINQHFRESTDYLRPAHIIERSAAIGRRRRFVALGECEHRQVEESGYCSTCGADRRPPEPIPINTTVWPTEWTD